MSCTTCGPFGTGTGTYNFTIDQGTTVFFGLEYLDSNEMPVDLSGFSSRMQVRSAYADDKNTLYFTLSSSFDPDGSGLDMGGIYGNLPPSSGSIGIHISADKTSKIKYEEAVYDLELYSGSYVGRLLEGSIFIRKEVTRV
jgi:hypothetical protein